MLRASHTTTQLLLATLLLASFAATAYGFCHCQLTCPNGETFVQSLNGTCDNCNNQRCAPYWNSLETLHCHQACTPSSCTQGYSCGNVSELAAGIIAAIVIGVLVLVVFAPLLFCFCMGVACFAGRRQRPAYQVVHHTYGAT